MILIRLPSASSGRGSDAALALAAEARLRDSSHPELRNVRCICRNGVLTLTGKLSSYDLKRLAQDCVSRIEGLSRTSGLMNCIDVDATADAGDR
jgi:osmotically-inducible protein OsmY